MDARVARVSTTVDARERVNWVSAVPFLLMHVACLAAFWTGTSWRAAGLCLALYVIRMFAITGGYHRYFSHRSYRTSRAFQFVLAWVGSAALQKGPLWWAAHHRHHHRHSDRDPDLHSPGLRGFWWAHVGWILCDRYKATDLAAIKDFAAFPELRWLNRYHVLPGVLLAVGCFVAMGWQGLVWGFFISTVLLYHGTFVINSLCHIMGSVRYETHDDSRNSLLLAIITLGEGWHNNHHYFAASTRMGFVWWEIDVTYYMLKLLSVVGLVWDLRTAPARVLEAGRLPPRRSTATA